MGYIPIGNSYNSCYCVEIYIDSDHILNNSSSSVAYTMLHEAFHAKLIGEYYDQTRSTDFKTLFEKHNNLYGSDVQHFEMLLNEYISQLAQGVKEFDSMSGINKSLFFYQKAINYQIRNQLKLNLGDVGENEYNEVFYNLPKNCK